MRGIKSLLTTFALSLLVVSPALAADTTKTYTSGILVLAFVGFCALLVVVQLVPAIRSLIVMSKETAKKNAAYKQQAMAAKKL